MILRSVLCRPFIGRHDELAFLRERRLEAASSHGSLVLIGGDAGVGKSRLIAEFCTTLAYTRWKVGYGACLEVPSRPYGPILEALARIDPHPFDVAEAATQREQFDAIVERFAQIATRTALVVVVEDVHWADAATLDLLAHLGAKLHRLRILVLASFRADEMVGGRAAAAATAKISRAARGGRIDLGPLRGVELQTFIDEALQGHDLPPQTRRSVALAGDGNPFFTEELLKSAVERSATPSSETTRREVPHTLRAALLDRLAPFDDAERRIVTQAAVIGRTFGLDLLAATLEIDRERIIPALRRARDVQLVEEISPAVFRFRHGLTREAIYGDFLGAEVQPRHRTIALAIENAPEKERSLEALAYHWWAAGDAQKALHYNERAGDAAGRIHAHEDAIGFYERALEFDAAPLARGAIIEKIANRRLSLGWTKEAQASYAAAADAFRDATAYEREARCRATAAITAYGTGIRNPTAALEAMLERLDDGEYRARSRVHLGLAWLAATFWFPSRASEHLALVDPRALEEAPDIALRFHNVSSWVAMTVGDLPTFRREHSAWIEAARAGGSLHALAGAHTNGAMCYAFFGLHDEAEDQLTKALRAARDARSRHSEESVHAFAAMCALLRGDLKVARAELDRVSPASENRVNITFATAWGTIVAAATGDEALTQRWFDGFEATVAPAPEVECGAGFAELMVRRGRLRDATGLLHRALPDCELLRGNVMTLLAVARYGAPADRERGRRYLERAAAAPTELPERPALALFDAIVAQRDGRTHEAVSLARVAATGFERMRMPLLEAASLELAGDAESALRVFRRCGAAYEVRRLEGGAKHDAAEAESAARLLSAREREIATLAAKGRSNLEIARDLSITHKTVEKHLASVYRKLNVTSRTHLGAFLN